VRSPANESVVVPPGARGIDRVAAFGAAVALAACLLLPLAMFRANRIVEGSPQTALSTGSAGWVLLGACLAALAVALLARPAVRARALPFAASALTVALAWALGRAAVALRAGQPDISRVSIGSGAWLMAAGCAVVWFASRDYDGASTFRRAAAAVSVAGFAGAALAGGLAHLSIVTEYSDRAARFWSAAGTHLTLAGGSLLLAILIGVPLCVLSLLVRWLRAVTLGVVGLIQTVPSLALLGLLVFPLAALGLPGIGPLP